MRELPTTTARRRCPKRLSAAMPAILEQLLKAGADVESPNAEGQTALMTVARTNHVDAATVLLKHKANVNAREQWRGQTALMWAAAQASPRWFSCSSSTRPTSTRARMCACWARKVTAEPRPQNRPSGGFTALLLAAREGCVACAEILVTKGKADINLADPDNITPLNMALLNGRWDLAASLDQAGRERESLGYVGPRAAVFRGRLQHHAARRAARSAVGRQDHRAGSHRDAAAEGREPEHAAEAVPAVSLARSGSWRRQHAAPWARRR